MKGMDMNAIAQISRTQPAVINAAAQQDQQQYLTFMLGGEVYAMGILAIKEIIEYGNLTEIPRMPEFIRGVINLRGAVVPVVDLGARFGKRTTDITRRTCIVIIEVVQGEESHDIGVMEPAPSFGADIRADFIDGMGKIDDRFVVILDVNQVLSVDEMASLAGVGVQGK
jgi:purine-binding chemotaxis protein CheW